MVKDRRCRTIIIIHPDSHFQSLDDQIKTVKLNTDTDKIHRSVSLIKQQQQRRTGRNVAESKSGGDLLLKLVIKNKRKYFTV